MMGCPTCFYHKCCEDAVPEANRPPFCSYDFTVCDNTNSDQQQLEGSYNANPQC